MGADIYSKTCTQTWHYTITPEWATTCNVNGIYRLTFAFGGWGELPFEIRECQDRDTGEFFEEKTFEMEIKSSNFCPQVISTVVLVAQMVQSGSDWERNYETVTDPDYGQVIYDQPHFTVVTFGGRKNDNNIYDLEIEEFVETVKIISVQVTI